MGFFPVLEDVIRKENNLPPEFDFYRWSSEPVEMRGCEYLYMRWEGAIVPKVKSGKRAGRPNWRKKDKASVKSFILTKERIEAIERQWEQDTGKCYECEGSGQQWAGTNFVTHVTTYRECSKCNGSGKAKTAA